MGCNGTTRHEQSKFGSRQGRAMSDPDCQRSCAIYNLAGFDWSTQGPKFLHRSNLSMTGANSSQFSYYTTVLPYHGAQLLDAQGLNSNHQQEIWQGIGKKAKSGGRVCTYSHRTPSTRYSVLDTGVQPKNRRCVGMSEKSLRHEFSPIESPDSKKL